MLQIGIITNPNSRKNRQHPGRADRLRSIVGSLGEVHETDSTASIKPVLREFLRKRARYWVADGGDGALHWMLRTGMELLAEDEFAGWPVTLPLLPTRGGTIDFVATNVGIRGTAEAILTQLCDSLTRGTHVDEVEVDSMRIDGVEVTADGERPFRTYGFASAAGGIGQRFFAKYYADDDPGPRTILQVVAKTVASMPVSLSPLSRLPILPAGARTYARDMFAPTAARVTLDGEALPDHQFTGLHVASMSIHLGVLQFFGEADQAGVLHAIVGSPSPATIVANLPRMTAGKPMRGDRVVDRPCTELTIEADGAELLNPVIDGEYYRHVRRIAFALGPRVRIPKVTGARRR